MNNHPANDGRKRVKVAFVFGTRPEAIKVAPVLLAMRDHANLEPLVFVTGQHRQMLDQVLEVFGITPDHDLEILQHGQGLEGITTKALERLTPVLAQHKPDAMVVQGDTTTTFAGALAAFYAQIPVVHMEAGLRTNDRYSPFPEEINRRLTSQLATVHLAPTSTSCDNLVREGFDRSSILITGNTVIDALLWTVDKHVPYEDQRLEALDHHDRPVLLVTAHRRESWGDGMRAIGDALARIAQEKPELTIALPLHKNPLVRDAILPRIEGLDNIIVTEPLGYGEFSRLMNRSSLILTDSGGVQEEGPSLGKPVLVMRDTTERPEAVEAGTARLIGTDADVIVRDVLHLLNDRHAYNAMAHAVNPYGDGEAARRTVEAVGHLFGFNPGPDEFGDTDADTDEMAS